MNYKNLKSKERKYPAPIQCLPCRYKDKKTNFMPCCQFPGKLEYDKGLSCLSFEKINEKDINK